MTDGPAPTKVTVEAHLVRLLFHRRDERGMQLCEFASRCVRAGEVHELVTTVDRPREPGDRVDRVGFLGFAEIANAGVLERGDVVRVGQRRIGTVLGFDECHFPNHYNILIAVPEVLTATDLGLGVGETMLFEEPLDDR